MHDKTQLNKISQKTQKEKQNSSPPQKKKLWRHYLQFLNQTVDGVSVFLY